MGPVVLELRCPQHVDGIAVEPQPDWTFDSLLLELNSIEKKLNASAPFTKTQPRELSAVKGDKKFHSAFVMRVSDGEMESGESYCVESSDRQLVAGTRFACDEIDISDDDDESEEELTLETQCRLLNKGGLVEGALPELIHEHRLSVTEEIRNQILAFETDLIKENEKFAAALVQVKKYTESRREMDKKLDLQYQRNIAVALESHITAVQRDRESKSQIEERRIKDDAALEEAKRKEKALQEEKLRQEKLRAETEARVEAEKKKVEEENAAALEATKRAAKEASEKVAIETFTVADATKEANLRSEESKVVGPKEVQSAGLKGTASALELEDRRYQLYKGVAAQNEAMGLNSRKDYRSHGMQIARRIKTIAGSKENVRSKAGELTQLITSSHWPESAGIALFAEKVVSHCVNPTGSFNNAAFAYGHVIVLVTSKIPHAMDILLAELNKACIYTVPKYITYAESAFDTKETYYKAIGFQEEDGKMESTDSYVDRLSLYMKLYGALVQTEVDGVPNLHGLQEGWAWFARFLNALPANLYTAVALLAFLEMAGFALHRRYKAQFKKILNIIGRDFLPALKKRDDPKLNKVVANIQNYIESNKFLAEPDGWRLRASLESHSFVPDTDPQQQNYYPSNRSSFY